MERRNFLLFETVRYLWRRLFRRADDPFSSLDEPLVDCPQDAAQRRAFIRAGCMFPVVSTPEGGEPAHGVVLNLSGSGLLLLDRRELAMGTPLTVAGPLYGRDMRIAARIVRKDPALAGFDTLFAYGCEIRSIAEADRRHIVRAIFRTYRHLRQIDFGGLES